MEKTVEEQLADSNAKLAIANEAIAKQEKDVDQLIEMNADLQNRLEKAEKIADTVSLPTYEFGGVVYEFLKPQIKIRGRIITMRDVMADKSMMKDLVEKKTGMFRVKQEQV